MGLKTIFALLMAFSFAAASLTVNNQPAASDHAAGNGAWAPVKKLNFIY